MSIFENLEPDLRPDHLELRRLGIGVQQEQLKTILIRHGIQISSAVKTEMAISRCTYEEACTRFVQACDHLSASFHFMDLADAAQRPETVSEQD